jgi:hypothetical protein
LCLIKVGYSPEVQNQYLIDVGYSPERGKPRI